MEKEILPPTESPEQRVPSSGGETAFYHEWLCHCVLQPLACPKHFVTHFFTCFRAEWRIQFITISPSPESVPVITNIAALLALSAISCFN